MTRTRPTVLVAGTPDAIETVELLVGEDVHVISARSIDQAMGYLQRRVDLVVCNLRFDESRVFEFLQAVASLPPARRPPVVCCRIRPLSPRLRAGAELALEALGVEGFIDLDRLQRRHGPGLGQQMFRVALLSRLAARAGQPNVRSLQE